MNVVSVWSIWVYLWVQVQILESGIGPEASGFGGLNQSHLWKFIFRSLWTSKAECEFDLNHLSWTAWPQILRLMMMKMVQVWFQTCVHSSCGPLPGDLGPGSPPLAAVEGAAVVVVGVERRVREAVTERHRKLGRRAKADLCTVEQRRCQMLSRPAGWAPAEGALCFC